MPLTQVPAITPSATPPPQRLATPPLTPQEFSIAGDQWLDYEFTVLEPNLNATISAMNTLGSEIEAIGTGATTSEANALASEQASALSEANALASEQASALSEANALASETFIKSKILNNKASDPSVDDNGDPLTGGEYYFNTTLGEVRVYTGSVWKTAIDTYTRSEIDIEVANRRKQYAKETLERDVVVGDVTAGKATIILTADENLYGRILITDTTPLTSVAGELLISSDIRDLIVVNNDNVDYKAWRDNGAGVGVGGFVTVPANRELSLYCDGTNVYLYHADDRISTDVTGARFFATAYPNTSGKVKEVTVTINHTATGAAVEFFRDGLSIGTWSGGALTAGNRVTTFSVPHGSDYQINNLSLCTISKVIELS